jgi:hypothetical protein
MSQNKSGSGIQGMLAAIVIPAALVLSLPYLQIRPG